MNLFKVIALIFFIFSFVLICIDHIDSPIWIGQVKYTFLTVAFTSMLIGFFVRKKEG